MRKHTFVLLLASILPLSAQTAPKQKPSSARPGRATQTGRETPVAQNAVAAKRSPESIVAFLLPDNVAYPERLPEVPTADAIAALTTAQADAMGTRGDAIAYLMVVLGHERDANRTRLANSLRDCTRDPESCDERMVAYLGNLFERGDSLALEPLLNAAETGKLTDSLGATYGDMIAHDTRAFVSAVSRRSDKEQRRICRMVASGDGAGLPDESSGDIESALQKIASEVGPSSQTAMTCLNEIRAFAAK
ncbi:MAG TPA: hypothetical protein VD837_12050 [Terriglobales bacterium]|nr:hypothetical protein [Terriglobales bacterium]